MTVRWQHSFSKLIAFEACKYRYKLQYIDRVPQLPLPLDNPMERGNREHKLYEEFTTGQRGDLKGAVAKSFGDFEAHLEHLRDLHTAGMATSEQNWHFDQDWNVCDRDQNWLWVKLDFNVTDEENGISIVGDYKTGRSQYKAIEHIQQTQLYAAAVALRQDWADTIITELWYVDEGLVKPFTYPREQALMYVGRFNARFERIEQEKFWRPNPNRQTCRYCPYGKQNGNGRCEVAA